ncbi:FecR family protein (plasmid) [Pedobacter sp. BS3]|uniref:FecR family protein n=1 Tax=Pedobacter sp. BS3 TaxID=2567937 RepID=UPI0011EFF180|nr:FecR domain-containing protein [Pedobacter sp. BS3]TZF85692.1 FecR family protein [Pedobacter sp. BS3]
MEKNEFQQLAEKISNGTATAEEVALYNHYYNQLQEDAGWDSEKLGEQYQLETELHARITANLPGYTEYKRPFPYLKIAAAVALIFISVLVYLKTGNNSGMLAHNESKRFEHDVNPGRNRAVLTLEDGSQLNLDESGTGILAKQGNVQISKLNNGQIVYTATRGRPVPANKNLFNTITIPRGGQYQLTLRDGTKVWLNAASSLRFPALFTGKSRVVELNGEAYFEVAKKVEGGKAEGRKVPFIVKTATQEIEVLGTHFNVNAYADEKITKTTLLEGSVKVSSIKTGAVQMLKPGEQSQLTESGDIHLATGIDMDEAVAWKNELFYFNNTELALIMRQLSRWYDVEIDADNMPRKRFNGILSRNVKLSQVLQMMEKTSGLKFKIEERRISMLQ